MTQAIRKNIKQKTSRTIYERGLKQQISNIYAYSPWMDIVIFLFSYMTYHMS